MSAPARTSPVDGREGQGQRRTRSTYSEFEFEDTTWLLQAKAGMEGVELVVRFSTWHGPCLSTEARMTPAKARELAQGLLDAAAFYDSQTARLNAKQAAAQGGLDG